MDGIGECGGDKGDDGAEENSSSNKTKNTVLFPACSFQLIQYLLTIHILGRFAGW